MNRGEGKEARERLVKLALNEPKKAASELNDMAEALAECRNTSDIVFALSEIFCVSERTIFNDLKKRVD